MFIFYSDEKNKETNIQPTDRPTELSEGDVAGSTPILISLHAKLTPSFTPIGMLSSITGALYDKATR